MSNDQPNIIIYRTADGKSSVALFAKDGKVWLSQQQMAELFATSKPNISMHIANILKEKELNEISVVKKFLTTAADGKNYNVVFYSLGVTCFHSAATMWKKTKPLRCSLQKLKINFSMLSLIRQRKQLEAKQADADDLKMLEDIENQIKGKS